MVLSDKNITEEHKCELTKMFFREQQMLIRILRKRVGGEPDEFERDFMSMERKDFVHKYMSAETEAIPTQHLRPSLQNYFDDGPVFCRYCHKKFGTLTDQFMVDLRTGYRRCVMCDYNPKYYQDNATFLNIGVGILIQRRRYKNEVVAQEMLAPYLPVNKVIKLRIEGLDKFLDPDMLSQISFSSITYEMDANTVWFRRKF